MRQRGAEQRIAGKGYKGGAVDLEDSPAIKMLKKTERELKCNYDYTDNCRNDSESLNFGDLVFQENNSQCYSHH
jgi:hypothetical protein